MNGSSFDRMQGPLALAAALVLLGLALPAAAHSPPNGPQRASSLDAWRACLDGARPDSENVPPVSGPPESRSDLPGSGTSPMDLDASHDHVVVDFRNDLSNARIRAFGREHGLNLHLNSSYSDAPNVFVATVAEGAVPYIDDCLARRGENGQIQSVEENINYTMLGSAPNDPLYQFQWNFKQIDVEEAWDTTAGDGVVVAVSDTGVAFDEDPSRDIERPQDLEGTERVDGYDFVDDDEFAWDGHGHGTHVAGTIAQTTNNGFGVAGVAHESAIMPLRVLNSSGFGDIADIADSIRYAADNGADIVNLSLGGPLPSLVLKRAINYAHEQGVTIIAAAGNSGSRAPSYPAAFKHVVAVSATQYDETTTFYSQWGEFVDLAAPGGNTRVDQNDDGRPDGVMQQTLKDGQTDEHDFVLFMGTSMASPHAAAGAALVASQGITRPSEIEEVLSETADDSQRSRFDDPDEYAERYGAGIINLDDAVASASLEPGSWRFAGGGLLLLLALFGVRRRRFDDLMPSVDVGLIASTVMASSGIFVLTAVTGDLALGGVLDALARPFAEWDGLLFGAGADQSPLLASFLLPLGAWGLLGGHDRLKSIACGLAIGTAAFCTVEAFLLTSDVHWVPGTGLLDRTWLAANGLISFAIGYLGLDRD